MQLDGLATQSLRFRPSPFRSILLTWNPDVAEPIGRHALWIDNAIPLRYEFLSPPPERLDEQWLNTLADLSSRAGGLFFSPQPAEPVAF